MYRWIGPIVGIMCGVLTTADVSAAPARVNARSKVERQARDVFRAANRLALKFKEIRAVNELFGASYDAADEIGDLSGSMAESIKGNRWQNLEDQMDKLDQEYDALKRQIDKLQTAPLDANGNSKVEAVLDGKEQLQETVDELDDLRDKLRDGIKMLAELAEQQQEHQQQLQQQQEQQQKQAQQAQQAAQAARDQMNRGIIFDDYYWNRNPGYYSPNIYPDYPIYPYFPIYQPAFQRFEHIEIRRSGDNGTPNARNDDRRNRPRPPRVDPVPQRRPWDERWPGRNTDSGTRPIDPTPGPRAPQ